MIGTGLTLRDSDLIAALVHKVGIDSHSEAAIR